MGSIGTNTTSTSVKKCVTCKRSKKLHLFNSSRNCKDGKANRCRSCEKKRDNNYRRTARGAASKLLKSIKQRCIKKGFKPPEITINDIMDRLENGKCEVTGRRFDVAYKSKYFYNPFTISVDRIDNSKGYSKDNIRYVMYWVNAARGIYDIEDFKKWVKGVKW